MRSKVVSEQQDWVEPGDSSSVHAADGGSFALGGQDLEDQDLEDQDLGPDFEKSGLASTAKVYRIESDKNKMMIRGDTWMCRLRGTVSWSLFNQGWFKSRAVSSRKQGQRVGALGKAFTFGLICRVRRMRDLLQLTSPLFLFGATGPAASLKWAAILLIPLLSLLLSSLANKAHAETKLEMTKPEPLKVQPQVQALKFNPKLDPSLQKKREPRVLEAAKMYEIYFLNQMMKAMRGTVQYSEKSKPSMGEGLYREQLDDQYVNNWADRGGVGLSELIHDDLVGKWNSIKEIKDKRRRAKTAMPLTDRDVIGMRSLPATKPGEQRILVSVAPTIASSKSGVGPDRVQTPWEMDVSEVRTMEGKSVLKGRAVDGRQVQMAWDGVTVSVRPGDHLQPQQTVGELAKGARGILLTTSGLPGRRTRIE